MPVVSKYENARIEKIMEKLITVLIEEKASADLSLMCLGNTVTNVICQQVPEHARTQIIDSFTDALKKSVANATKTVQ
jgi:hypothetical protein